MRLFGTSNKVGPPVVPARTFQWTLTWFLVISGESQVLRLVGCEGETPGPIIEGWYGVHSSIYVLVVLKTHAGDCVERSENTFHWQFQIVFLFTRAKVYSPPLSEMDQHSKTTHRVNSHISQSFYFWRFSSNGFSTLSISQTTNSHSKTLRVGGGQCECWNKILLSLRKWYPDVVVQQTEVCTKCWLSVLKCGGVLMCTWTTFCRERRKGGMYSSTLWMRPAHTKFVGALFRNCGDIQQSRFS